MNSISINNHIIRVLLVEDQVENLVGISNDSETNFEFIRAKTLKESLNNFSQDEFDVIVLDMNLPDSAGFESFNRVYEEYPNKPVITLTTDFNGRIGQQTVEYGAEDYLVKDELNDRILIRSIKNAIIRKKTERGLDTEVKESKLPHKLEFFNVKLLKEYEQGLSEIIDFLPDATFVIDLSGRVIAWNRAIEEMTGVKADEILGKGNYAYSLPFYGKRRPILIDQVVEWDKEIANEYHFIKREGDALLTEVKVFLRGEHRVLWVKAVPLYDNKSNITGAIQSIRDITEYRRAQEKIEEALEEKNVLLKEIHHRVKNNLQIISSLLGLQEGYVKGDPTALNVLRVSKNRVLSMAMVHEMLYKSDDIRNININNYIKNLTTNLFSAYKEKRSTTPKVNVDQICLNIETAIPLGLIISELVSNSLKYAFPNENGDVSVDLHSYNGGYRLVISDDGVGFPKDLDYRNTEATLGLKLVNSLVNQLDGSIELDRNQGTKFIIKFKELNYKERI